MNWYKNDKCWKVNPMWTQLVQLRTGSIRSNITWMSIYEGLEILRSTPNTFKIWYEIWWLNLVDSDLGKPHYLWVGGTRNNGNHYNSGESPYFRLIFHEHTYWPPRNPKQLALQNFSPPPQRCVKIVRPPLSDFVRPPPQFRPHPNG